MIRNTNRPRRRRTVVAASALAVAMFASVASPAAAQASDAPDDGSSPSVRSEASGAVFAPHLPRSDRFGDDASGEAGPVFAPMGWSWL